MTHLNWQPIETAPTDDREFMVGSWNGEKAFDKDWNHVGWVGEPHWEQALSHHENPHGPHLTRGWNHRNGPLRHTATHWHDTLPPPAKES